MSALSVLVKYRSEAVRRFVSQCHVHVTANITSTDYVGARGLLRNL